MLRRMQQLSASGGILMKSHEKIMTRRQVFRAGTVCCVWACGQEKHTVTGTTLFFPTDTEYVMKSDCEMEQKKNGRQEGVGGDEAQDVCPHWVLLLPAPSIHFSSHCSLRVHVCVTSYPHKRFCILPALFILSFSSIFGQSFNVLPADI